MEGKGLCSSVLGGGGGGLSLSCFSHQLPSSSLLLHVEMVEIDSVSLSRLSFLSALAFLVEFPSVVVVVFGGVFFICYGVKHLCTWYIKIYFYGPTCTHKHDMIEMNPYLFIPEFPEATFPVKVMFS